MTLAGDSQVNALGCLEPVEDKGNKSIDNTIGKDLCGWEVKSE